jgi:hypothetical protein
MNINIDMNININAYIQGATALHIAAELNLPKAITEFLSTEEGAEALNLKDRAGLRALHR